MSQKKELSQRAVGHFNEGYNCAQSVLLTLVEHWKGKKSSLVPKVATGFGGGIGRCGSVCGALTGAVMAIGIKYGTNEPSVEKRLDSYELSQRLYKRFEKQHGGVRCKELIGYDLSVPEELEKAHDAKVFKERCSAYIKTAVEALLEFEQS